MADASFYGGKPGFSFIIVANYTTIDEMVTNFQLGPSYTAVHFEEHVLINTEDKNDPDNGKIYRRGYDYTNDMGGAIYVGTIVGPAGAAPMVELTTIEEVQAKQAEAEFEYRYSEGSYAVPDSLLPGFDGDSTYNDEIQWACCSVRDENNEDCTAYIGFIIPYLVVDVTASSVDPYYNRSDDTSDFTNEDLASRTDDGTHAFYEKWNFSVPKGIQGDSFKNFRIVSGSDVSGVRQLPYASEYYIPNDRQILVYDYYNYETSSTGDPVTLYLGDYNMIEGITIDEEGTITISYTFDDDTVYTNLFKWIESVALDPTNGHFTVTYNYDEDSTTYETDLVWVSGVEVSSTGEVTISYINGDTEILDTILNFILEMKITDDYHLIVYYSSPDIRKAIVDAGTHYTYDGDSEWADLGSIKEESGILIGLNLSVDEQPELEDILTAIDYLNSTYPDGLTGTDLKGKIVTVGLDDGTKLFYAFDYSLDDDGNYKGWYYLGTLTLDTSTLFMVSTEIATDVEEKQTGLSVGGLWFVVEE